MMLRQGDVLLVAVEAPEKAVPLDTEPDGRVVLAYGEATGHAHALQAEDAALFQTSDGDRFLRVVSRTDLRHEEHAPVTLVPGWFRVVQQREAEPTDGSWRWVAD